MLIEELYHTCRQGLSNLRPDERKTRLRHFSWMFCAYLEGKAFCASFRP